MLPHRLLPLPHATPCRRHAPATRVFLLALVLALLVAPLGCHAASPLVATATVAPCVGAAVDRTEPPGCLRKLVLEAAYTPSAAGDASVSVASVVDLSLVPGSSTPSTATLAGSGLHMDVTAAAVMTVEYALAYQRQYDAGMGLVIDQVDPSGSCSQLTARMLCPGYTQVDGTVVASASGRCCLCETCAPGACAAGSLAASCASAHQGFAQLFCAKPFQLAYDGYGVGSGQLQYPVSVAVSGLGLVAADGGAALVFAANATTAVTTVRASAAVGAGAGALPTTLEVAAQGMRDAVDVSSHVLFAPSGTASTADDWVLLPASLVSVDGSECDKVGVSAETYYRLANTQTCSASRGWCLQNQLLDFVSAAKGGGDASGSHMAASMGAFAMDAARAVLVRTAVSGEGLVTLRWTASADDVAYATDPSAGAIVSAVRVADAAGGGASLHVTVVNGGARASWYGVRVASCSGGVSAGAGAPRVVLDAGASTTVSVAVLGHGDAAGDARASCDVVLLSSSGARLDAASVSWEDTAPASSLTCTCVCT